jgi:hypothetical protein
MRKWQRASQTFGKSPLDFRLTRRIMTDVSFPRDAAALPNPTAIGRRFWWIFIT